ncbi:YqaJ viral recombinase family protein [Acinetobacter sp. YH12251]|uniref:YqaJ viral recombinase family protein n=1 Tax=Acinetobacter sp. YH12251 TaxID=2601176 RepID=UPI001C554F68|nr:YqaJ viral recombinase family protein [Acinetobacter sp. YH12251]
MKLFRCSSLHKLIGDAQSIASELRNDEINTLIRKKKRTEEENALVQKLKDASLSDTAKNAIRDVVKEDLYTFHSFKGNQFTAKGNLLEDLAIEMSGKMRFKKFKKHEGRVNTDLITGECDILDLDRKLIIDTKCTWDIGTHPFFIDEAMEKVKKAGYDIQMQAYMWLYECEVANIDFWLFPCPIELTKDWDDREQLIDLVEKIDIRERLTTVVIERDETIIQKIKDKIPHCQAYYEKLFTERSKGRIAA